MPDYGAKPRNPIHTCVFRKMTAHCVARLVDDHERAGKAAEQRVRVALPVRDGGALGSTSPSRVVTHAQWDDFPTSSPMMASGIPVGATAVPSNR